VRIQNQAGGRNRRNIEKFFSLKMKGECWKDAIIRVGKTPGVGVPQGGNCIAHEPIAKKKPGVSFPQKQSEGGEKEERTRVRQEGSAGAHIGRRILAFHIL